MAKADASGCRGSPARSAIPRAFLKVSAGTSWRSGIPKTATWCREDVATRAIHKVVYEHNLGIDGQPMVYLDLTHIDRATLDRKLEGILEIYEKFVGDDPRDVPMKIFNTNELNRGIVSRVHSDL